MEELKACPFCGNSDLRHIEKYEHASPTDHYIKCKKCFSSAFAGPYKEKQDAIKAWNTRQSIQVSEIEKVIEELAKMESVFKTANGVSENDKFLLHGRSDGVQMSINELKKLIEKEA